MAAAPPPMSLLLRDYDYPLPQSLIAAHPLPDRSSSRMMVLHRAARLIEHRSFSDFPSFLTPGDLAVLNDTKVIPARAFSDDGRIEFLFLEPAGENRWLCMVKPGRKLPLAASTSVGGIPGIVSEILPTGERLIQFQSPIDLDRIGQIPIPPYLGRPVEPADSEIKRRPAGIIRRRRRIDDQRIRTAGQRARGVAARNDQQRAHAKPLLSSAAGGA